MAFKDILVALTSYPEPTPVSVVEDAVSVAAVARRASRRALLRDPRSSCRGTSFRPRSSAGMIAAETAKSRKNAQELLAAFDAAAEKAGILHEAILEKCITLEVPDLLVEYARLRDLTILSVPESFDQWYAEAIIFGSGRPTLILPENPRPPAVPARDRRGGLGFQPRRRARDIRRPADAGTGEEGSHRHRHQREGAGHQTFRRRAGQEPGPARHRCRAGQGRRQGRAIGTVLESYTSVAEVDVLVMGAYGHSRLREFVLGGATRSLLSKPPLPILFSH